MPFSVESYIVILLKTSTTFPTFQFTSLDFSSNSPHCPPTAPFTYSSCLLSSCPTRSTFHKSRGVICSVHCYIIGILNSPSYRVGFNKYLQNRWMPAHWKTKIKTFILMIWEHKSFEKQSCNEERWEGDRICVYQRLCWQIFLKSSQVPLLDFHSETRVSLWLVPNPHPVLHFEPPYMDSFLLLPKKNLCKKD